MDKFIVYYLLKDVHIDLNALVVTKITNMSSLFQPKLSKNRLNRPLKD